MKNLLRVYTLLTCFCQAGRVSPSSGPFTTRRRGCPPQHRDRLLRHHVLVSPVPANRGRPPSCSHDRSAAIRHPRDLRRRSGRHHLRPGTRRTFATVITHVYAQRLQSAGPVAGCQWCRPIRRSSPVPDQKPPGLEGLVALGLPPQRRQSAPLAPHPGVLRRRKKL